MNRNDSNEPSNDDLDRAICEALAVDADPRRVARLERFWLVQSRRQLWRRRAWQIIPAAAAALLLVALFIVARRGDDSSQSAGTVRRLALDVQSPVRDDTVLADDSDVRRDARSSGRAPTDYERFVFLARTNALAASTTLVANVDGVIEQVKAHRDSEVADILQASGIESSDAAKVLLRRLRRSNDGDQVAILRLLAVCGTPQSVPAIVRAVQRSTNHDEVLSAIERIAGTEGLAQVAGSTTDSKLRSAVARRLLAIDSDAALLEYLSLVRNDATRTAALAAADEVPSLPIERLLALFDFEDKSVRMSAAMVLGHVNGPEVTRLLIARVTEQPSDATEAWVALMACRGDLAEEFLTYASRRPQLLGHLNSARVQWAQMTP
ncbi:MAG: hypothetical protein L0228_14200 [Planctomycetes bacterium]|nr:hypothetical protein [Planctomycetota bacterium]